jgi:hypothetical protein
MGMDVRTLQNAVTMSIPTAKDHALATVKAALNLVPVVGGAIASLIGDYVPSSTQRAIERTTELLGEKLEALQGRIDVEAVNKEDFSELFKSCYLVVVRSNREEKLHAAAAVLANMLLQVGDPIKASYEELDHFIRCIDALSVGALSVLGAARRTASTSGQGGQSNFQFSQLRSSFPQFDTSFLMSLVSELRALNLLRVQEGAIRIPDHGEVLLEITPVGLRLVERFIEGRT